MKRGLMMWWLTAFSMAMGYLETMIVVLLRRIYYPSGFRFPLQPIDPFTAQAEFWREAATLVMLAGVAAVAGRTRLQRWSFFLFCFAVWDLAYYVFLKLLLDWPESLATWDILFLIPMAWIGPVWAPCVVSISFILFQAAVTRAERSREQVYFSGRQTAVFVAGCAVIVLSFLWYPLPAHALSLSQEALFLQYARFVPQWFNWPLFAAGQGMVLASFMLMKFGSGTGEPVTAKQRHEHYYEP